MSTNEQSVHSVALRAVTKTYVTPAGGFSALANVTLSLRPGELVAVVGKSGSGKSTLVNLIAGIDRPTQGEVLVRGVALHELDESPELVVADEPTGNLDSRTAEEVLALLTALSRAGKTVVVVTHERDWLERFDRVVTLVDGHVADDAPTRAEAASDSCAPRAGAR